MKPMDEARLRVLLLGFGFFVPGLLLICCFRRVLKSLHRTHSAICGRTRAAATITITPAPGQTGVGVACFHTCENDLSKWMME